MSDEWLSAADAQAVREAEEIAASQLAEAVEITRARKPERDPYACRTPQHDCGCSTCAPAITPRIH